MVVIVLFAVLILISFSPLALSQDKLLTSHGTTLVKCVWNGSRTAPSSAEWTDEKGRLITNQDQKYSVNEGVFRDEKQVTTLEIKKLEKDEKYTCSFVFKNRKFSRIILVDHSEVEGIGAITNGTESVLTCNLLGAKTLPEMVEWKLDGKLITPSSNYEIIDREFTTMLKVKTPTEDQTLTCSFVYSNVNFEAVVFLNFVVVNGVGVLTDGKAADLSCTLLGAKTEPEQIRWKLSDKFISSDEKVKITGEPFESSLRVKTPTEDKTFTCSFIYKNVKFEAPVFLDFVEEEPSDETSAITNTPNNLLLTEHHIQKKLPKDVPSKPEQAKPEQVESSPNNSRILYITIGATLTISTLILLSALIFKLRLKMRRSSVRTLPQVEEMTFVENIYVGEGDNVAGKDRYITGVEECCSDTH